MYITSYIKRVILLKKIYRHIILNIKKIYII